MSTLIDVAKELVSDRGGWLSQDGVSLLLTLLDGQGQYRHQQIRTKDLPRAAEHVVETLRRRTATEAALTALVYSMVPHSSSEFGRDEPKTPCVLLSHADTDSASMWVAPILAAEGDALTVGEWETVEENVGIFLDMLRLGIG